MKRILNIFISFSLVLISVSHALQEEPESQAEYHREKGDAYVKENRNFLAIEEYRMAIKHGINHPALFRKVARLLYMVGLIDESIAEMEKAVDLSPEIDAFRIELGVLYMAKDRMEEAEEQLHAALKINPGFTNVYYYLGKLYIEAGDYGMAWLSAKMAGRMGHRGQSLFNILKGLSKEPAVNPWDNMGKELYIRQILVDTRMKAEYLVGKISEGEMFEAIASDVSIGPNSEIGGYMGHFEPSALHPEISGSLLKQEVLAVPIIVETEKGFHIVQRLVPFNEKQWKEMLDSPAEPQKEKTQDARQVIKQKEKTFIVYAGSFKDKKNAIKRVKDLRKDGYPSFRFLNKSKSEKTLHNVVVGQYNNIQKAREVKESISRRGYGSFIVEY
ncbi:MAG: SPOR domain-containing protein [Nitrospirota bacterium]